VSEAVRRFDGYIAKFMGDGVLIYFGYPNAQEKDAERAVRTGLAILDALPALNAGTAGGGNGTHFAVRVGDSHHGRCSSPGRASCPESLNRRAEPDP
jgi:class 3 adenylate cyclase